MDAEAKKKSLERLSRIEGQVRGIARMIESGRYCIDIMTQISAVQAALRKVEGELLKSHVAHCVEHAIRVWRRRRSAPEDRRVDRGAGTAAELNSDSVPNRPPESRASSPANSAYKARTPYRQREQWPPRVSCSVQSARN